jgi:hypothetical protein
MPVKSCQLDGRPGFRWGDQGKCYTYDATSDASREEARARATAQGAAAYAAGYVGKAKAPDQQSFTPPQDVRAAAAKGLALRREFGRGGLDPQQASEQGIGSGVVRAGQLKSGRPITYDTIKRMVNYFSRHGSDKDAKGSDSSGYWGRDSNPSAGYVAWLLWGGNPGKRWAEGIKAKVERQMEDRKKQRRFKPGSRADQANQSQPAKPSERRRGSRRNKPGTATAGGARDIKMSPVTMKGIKAKVKEHNDKHGDTPSKKVTTSMLAAVYRRGAGAFSVSHRPGMTRGQWAMARVNHFLRLVRTGKPADKRYITDNDLLPKGHPRSTRGIKKMHGPHHVAQRLIDLAMEMLGKADDAACPIATQDVEVNTANRDAAIKADHIQYGPLNVAEPGDYWEQAAAHWDAPLEAAQSARCSNCVAFDVSPRMKACMPGQTSDNDGVLGYCWMHHFKCHSARSCRTWAKGGPIKDDEISIDWQMRADGIHDDDHDEVDEMKGYDYDVSISFPIAKADAEQRIVMGVVLEPNVVDAHNDFETPEAIERAAHDFLSKYNRSTQMGVMHKMFGQVGLDLIESYIAPQDLTLGSEPVKKGSWVMAVKVVDDALWAKVKGGQLTGFSIGGKARVNEGEAPK